MNPIAGIGINPRAPAKEGSSIVVAALAMQAKGAISLCNSIQSLCLE